MTPDQLRRVANILRWNSQPPSPEQGIGEHAVSRAFWSLAEAIEQVADEDQYV